MAPQRKSTSVWTAFSRRHRRSPFIQTDPHYAIPETLIDAAADNVPNFWSDDEICFERDLTVTASGGFSLQQPFPCPLSSPAPDPSTAAAGAVVHETENDLLREHGLNQFQINHYRQRTEQQRQHANLRTLASAG